MLTSKSRCHPASGMFARRAGDAVRGCDPRTGDVRRRYKTVEIEVAGRVAGHDQPTDLRSKPVAAQPNSTAPPVPSSAYCPGKLTLIAVRRPLPVPETISIVA